MKVPKFNDSQSIPNVHIFGKLFNTMKGLKFTFLNRIMMFVENKLQT